MIPIRPSLRPVARALIESDAGPWLGISTEAWLARFGPPAYLGPRRRRTDRLIRIRIPGRIASVAA